MCPIEGSYHWEGGLGEGGREGDIKRRGVSLARKVCWLTGGKSPLVLMNRGNPAPAVMPAK